jgi:hypothetical protein
MPRCGFSFGSNVRFQSHDQGEVVGIVLGESFASDLTEREYAVLYRGLDGAPLYDPQVAESYMRPADGWISPENHEGLHRLMQDLVAQNIPEVELPDE